MPTYRRRADGVFVAGDNPCLSNLSAAARDAAYEEIEADGMTVTQRAEIPVQAPVAVVAPASVVAPEPELVPVVKKKK